MNYNASRENLLIEHMNALRALGNVWNSRSSGLLVPFLNLSPDDAQNALWEQLPALLLPFQLSSAQIGARFYDMRREQAINALPRTAAKPNNFLKTISDIAVEQLTASTSNKMGFLQASIKQNLEEQTPEKFIDDFNRATSIMVAQPDRETINDFILEDDWAASKVRVAHPDGCVFCQSMTGSLPIDDDDVEFHNHCNCVLDAGFDKEVKFRQSFSDKVEQEREKAIELIRSGDAGTTNLPRGSQEWKKSVETDLQKQARDWRKEFEANNPMTKSERADLRARTKQNAEEMAAKAALVAKGQATWNRQDILRMKLYGTSPTQLNETRTRPLGNNNKDILKAMEIVRGTRSAKLPDNNNKNA